MENSPKHTHGHSVCVSTSLFCRPYLTGQITQTDFGTQSKADDRRQSYDGPLRLCVREDNLMFDININTRVCHVFGKSLGPQDSYLDWCGD